MHCLECTEATARKTEEDVEAEKEEWDEKVEVRGIFVKMYVATCSKN